MNKGQNKLDFKAQNLERSVGPISGKIEMLCQKDVCKKIQDSFLVSKTWHYQEEEQRTQEREGNLEVDHHLDNKIHIDK